MDILYLIASRYPKVLLIIAYITDKKSVVVNLFDIRQALAAGAIKNDIASIAPTDSNAATQVSETRPINI